MLWNLNVIADNCLSSVFLDFLYFIIIIIIM